MLHEFDIYHYCVRCGASAQSVADGERDHDCPADVTKLLPISSRIAARKFAAMPVA